MHDGNSDAGNDVAKERLPQLVRRQPRQDGQAGGDGGRQATAGGAACLRRLRLDRFPQPWPERGRQISVTCSEFATLLKN